MTNEKKVNNRYLFTNIATLLTIVEFRQGWKSVNNLLDYFKILISLFLFIFVLFYVPRALKQNRQTTKKLDEIRKKAKVNNPEKYRIVNLILKISAPFFLLGIIALLWFGYTIPEENWVGKAQICLLVISLSTMSCLFYLSLMCYCHEISQPKKEEPKTGAEPL